MGLDDVAVADDCYFDCDCGKREDESPDGGHGDYGGEEEEQLGFAELPTE